MLSAACATPTDPGSPGGAQGIPAGSLSATYQGSGDSRTIYASGKIQLTSGGNIRSALYAVASKYPEIDSYFFFASQPRHTYRHGISAVVNDTVPGDYPLRRSCDIESPAQGRCALLVLVITPDGAFSTSSVYYGHEGALQLTRDGDRIRGTFAGVAYEDPAGEVVVEPEPIRISDGSFDLPVLPHTDLGPLMSRPPR